MHRRKFLLAWAAGVAGSAGLVQAQTPLSSPPPEVASLWPQARVVGNGTLRFLGLRIYDAQLWSPGPVTPDGWRSQPLALALTYARPLKGQAIATRSLEEMQRQGPIDAQQAERWLRHLQADLPDVKEGDRLTVLQQPGSGTRLYANGQLRSTWTDAAFGQRFFGIWLAEETSEPTLREALFGGRA